MRLYSFISNSVLNGRRFISLVIFFVFGLHLCAQEGQQEAAYIQNKLNQVDSLINLGQFNSADNLIKNTLNTFSFKKNSEQQLAFDFRTAKNFYQQDNKEKAMEILLNGLDRLKGNPFSQLNIDYTNLLARIFADSQNFDKAIYYNKIALQKANLIQDTVSITKGFDPFRKFLLC